MRFFRYVVRSAVGGGLAVVVLIFAYQDKMIYHPRRYPETQKAEAAEGSRPIVPLDYATSAGAQRSYYVPPRVSPASGVPATLWVFFNGNGSLALEWMHLVSAYPSADDAFLLIEYPGYGRCEGHPTSWNIQEAANAALRTLAARLGVPEKTLEPRLKAFGHSLGAANALAFASLHPVSSVVLIAPFSSLQDMARITVGTPLCYLLLDNFDNRARLREIAARPAVPPVEIFSGTRDGVIPFTQGRELAGIAPCVRFHEVPGAGHNDILGLTDRIFAAMAGK